MLAHNVYFKLVDDSEASKEALVANCRKYLAPSPGIVFFGVGMLAEGLARDVNDRDFDVSLQIVFKDLRCPRRLPGGRVPPAVYRRKSIQLASGTCI